MIARSEEKIELSKKLEKDMEEFLKNGGEVKEIPSFQEARDIPYDQWNKMRKRAEKPRS